MAEYFSGKLRVDTPTLTPVTLGTSDVSALSQSVLEEILIELKINNDYSADTAGEQKTELDIRN